MGAKYTDSAVASAFFFGFSLLRSRNLSPFLLPQYWPFLAPEIPVVHLERNSLRSKRAQAVVYCVLYTMNIFAFANRLKIVPPLIVI